MTKSNSTLGKRLISIARDLLGSVCYNPVVSLHSIERSDRNLASAGSFVSSLNRSLSASKSISSQVMEQLYVLKAKCIGATINIKWAALPQMYNVGKGRTETLRWGLLDPIASKNSIVLETMSLFLNSSNGSHNCKIMKLEDVVETMKPNPPQNTMLWSDLGNIDKIPRLDFLMPEKGEEKNDDDNRPLKGPCNIIDLLLQCENTSRFRE